MYINAIVRMQSFISFPRIFTELYCNTFNLKQNKLNQIILKWNGTKSGSFSTKSDFVRVEILFWGQYLLIKIELACSLNWMNVNNKPHNVWLGIHWKKSEIIRENLKEKFNHQTHINLTNSALPNALPTTTTISKQEYGEIWTENLIK